jgi:hypothetical protein
MFVFFSFERQRTAQHFPAPSAPAVYLMKSRIITVRCYGNNHHLDLLPPGWQMKSFKTATWSSKYNFDELLLFKN